MITDIDGESGLFKVEKVKFLYLIGYTENYEYMINLDTGKAVVNKEGDRNVYNVRHKEK